MKNMFYGLFAATFLLSVSASANLGKAGNARCGIGTVLLGSSNGMLSQACEASTNGIFYHEAFAITTGTSGCSNSGIVDVNKEQLFYANVNLENLMLDMSKGEGESIAGLAELMGCGEYTKDFGQVTKKNFGNIIEDGSEPEQILIRVKENIESDPVLSLVCTG